MTRESMRLRAENDDPRCQLRDAKSLLVDDFVEKLRSLPHHYPERSHLIRMIIDLSREIERGPIVPPRGAGVH